MIRLLTILLVAVLLFSSVAAVVYAASGGVTGSGKGGNTAPTIEAVILVSASDDTEVTAMTPLSPYRVKVTAGDINTIDDIQYIVFKVYYGTTGASWDADDNAIFKWDKDGSPEWTMENGGATTSWEIVTIDCVAPSDLSGTTGDWYLKFKPGTLAQQTDAQDWKCNATAYDENKNGTGAWATGATLAAYSAVDFDDGTGVSIGTITLGDATAGIEPGSTGYITDTAGNGLTVQVTTNSTYALGVQTEATWSDGGSNTITLNEAGSADLGPGEFALEIDNEEQGDPGQPKSPVAVTSSSATILGFESKPRVTTSQSAPEGTSDAVIYMALSFATEGIQEVTYSGTITFTVTN